ncbi:thioesterase [Psychrobacillus glaciei]|uniref:Thioesterase n=1 Tax=Psychrobacillus glaciei TaxID=2283160 RepID=A0A5J6SRY6_9BACI|nr:thioesterase domain-containing protein [Psychrobacillus glaciei]QFG00390.1 thioesterase [Psychrobacillus glaciei]
MKRTISKNKYIVLNENVSADIRLFCFPFAGGGASVFSKWSEELGHVFEVASIQLPGRETRIMEDPHTSMEDLIPMLAEDIKPYLDKKFIFFGHSMGTLIAFELSRFLEKIYNIKPLHLFLSSCGHPAQEQLSTPIHNLPYEEFVEELKRRNGTHQEVFDNKELLSLMLPYIRADFQICETYQYYSAEKLLVPITVLGGNEDYDVKNSDLERWGNETLGSFEKKIFSGDHFYLQKESKQSLQSFLIEQAKYYKF